MSGGPCLEVNSAAGAALVDDHTLRLQSQHDATCPVSLAQVGVSRAMQWPSRTRATFKMDDARPPHNPLATPAELDHQASVAAVRVMGTDNPTTPLQYVLEGRSVACPWPNNSGTLHRHLSGPLYCLNLTFALNSSGVSMEEMMQQAYNYQVLNRGDAALDNYTIPFRVHKDEIRKLVPFAAVDGARWDAVHAYHVMPTLIYPTFIDSNLQGLWQACLVSSLPTTSREIQQHTRKTYFTPTVVTTPEGKPLVQQVPVRETPVGGKEDTQVHSFHRLDGAMEISPEFGRWINVDCDDLLNQARAAIINPSGPTQALYNKARELDKGFRVDVKHCCVDIPDSWTDLYKQNKLNLAYVVLTGLQALRRIEDKSRSDQSIGPFPGFTAYLDESQTRLAVRYQTLETYINSFKQTVRRSSNLMRLDKMELHLSPVNPKEWDVLRARIQEQKRLQPKESIKARFTMDVCILYEPLVDSLQLGRAYNGEASPLSPMSPIGMY